VGNDKKMPLQQTKKNSSVKVGNSHNLWHSTPYTVVQTLSTYLHPTIKRCNNLIRLAETFSTICTFTEDHVEEPTWSDLPHRYDWLIISNSST